MEEKNKAPEQQEKKLSRTTLTFYIVALFSVAIALILISYVAQARADKQLESLSNKLNEQQTVAQGATQKMELLQQQLDEQQKILEELGEVLGTDGTALVDAAKQTAEERGVYALLARINAQLLAGNDAEAEDAFGELVGTYGEDRLSGSAEQGSFGSDINKLFEAAKGQIASAQPHGSGIDQNNQ